MFLDVFNVKCYSISFLIFRESWLPLNLDKKKLYIFS